MALSPSAMQMLRRGPAMGPSPTPGGAAPSPTGGLPATGPDPGDMLTTAIMRSVNEQKKSNANFAVGNVEQAMRVIGAMMVHLMQSHPDAARHLNRAWSSLDQANKALKEAQQEAGPPVGPSLGFAGAATGPNQQTGPGLGGGGTGVG